VARQHAADRHFRGTGGARALYPRGA
jgi:hypothetical protein